MSGLSSRGGCSLSENVPASPCKIGRRATLPGASRTDRDVNPNTGPRLCPSHTHKPFRTIRQLPPLRRGLNGPDAGTATPGPARLLLQPSLNSPQSSSILQLLCLQANTQPCHEYEFRSEAFTGSPREGGEEWGSGSAPKPQEWPAHRPEAPA